LDNEMNEPFSSEIAQTTEQPQKSRRGLAALPLTLALMLALMLAVASAVGVGWLWWQQFNAGSATTAEFAAAAAREAQQVASLESRIGTLEARVTSLGSADPTGRINTLEQDLTTLQDSASRWQAFQQETSAWTRSMQAAIEGDQARLATAEAHLAVLAARNMNSAAELNLAEIDYVLRLAQERLELFADVRTANQALAIAGQQLAAFNNPLYVGLQQDIAAARLQLAQVIGPDYITIYASLDSLQSAVLALPFKGEGATENGAPAEGETSWWGRIKQSFSGLVTVRRDNEIANSIPVFADQDLIRQHAWLELEIARLAALRRDQLAWTAALNRFAAVLAHWFDPGSAAARDALARLTNLKQVEIDPAMPDISAPLTALQAMRAAAAPAPVSVPVQEPVPAPAPVPPEVTEGDPAQ
jgi:uroporphyrin-3 C-methyltransferase